ncbi:MAG: amidohydrolase [Firmicutes bacterium]|nr:amidohydrolase [Bacillota bacterium]
MTQFKEKMGLFKNNRVVNWHEHVWFKPGTRELNEEGCDRLVEMAYLTYMDCLVCSLPIPGGTPGPDDIKQCNDTVAIAMKRHPKMIRGMAFINPGYTREALDEIDRCVNELGMIGIKLYNHYFVSDPVVRPIIEKCIDLDIPILHHAGKLTVNPESQPFLSNGVHFAKIAEEYPEAVIIHGHIGGGGDWQWSLKGMANCPNIFTDISGSVYDAGIIEKTVQAMGADRILFATDGSFASSIGKLLGADISEEDKIIILNNPRFEKYLERGMH